MGWPGEPGLPGWGSCRMRAFFTMWKILGLVVGLEVENEGVGRTVAEVVAASVVLRAAGDDGLLHGILRAHVEVAARAR